MDHLASDIFRTMDTMNRIYAMSHGIEVTPRVEVGDDEDYEICSFCGADLTENEPHESGFCIQCLRKEFRVE